MIFGLQVRQANHQLDAANILEELQKSIRIRQVLPQLGWIKEATVAHQSSDVDTTFSIQLFGKSQMKLFPRCEWDIHFHLFD